MVYRYKPGSVETQIENRGPLEIWLPIGCEQCQTKPNEGQNMFLIFFLADHPCIGGVAFSPIKNSLWKGQAYWNQTNQPYMSKVSRFITFSDKIWTAVKWLSKENLLLGKRLPPKYRVGLPGTIVVCLFWPLFGLVWHSSHPIGCHISKGPRWLI